MKLRNATVSDIEIDVEDDDLGELRWHVNGASVLHSTYDKATQHTGKIKLHRVIVGRMMGRTLASSEFVDHIDGNWRNNRRSNLRLVTHKQNRRNNRSYKNSTSKFVGVSWSATPRKWYANITVDAKCIAIGLYDDEEEAAWMRDQWTLALFGDYGHLNFEYV